VKLSEVERKPPDILSDLSETEVYCLSDPSELVSDPSELVSDRTVALSDVNQMLNGKSEYYCIKGELEMLF
jgi:hypothetical protein